MMQVYIDALRASSTGKPQYIIEDGLSITRTNDTNYLIASLRSGGTVKAKCVSGVLEENWRFYHTSLEPREKSAIEAIMAQIGLKADWHVLRIVTQEFYDSTYNLEAIYMFIELWKAGSFKPDTFYITPKDKVADPEGFRLGQEKAQAVLDILSHFHVKRDDQSIIQELTVLHRKDNNQPLDSLCNN